VIVPAGAELGTGGTRVAVDVGSTVVKVARLGPDDELIAQEFHARDFDAGIARQVSALLGGAHDSSCVLAHDSSRVLAHDSSRVLAHDSSRVLAHDSSRVLAHDGSRVLMCSSANGGLRVGIVCLTQHFSGSALRNQVLSAGANPIFIRDLDAEEPDLRSVDVLLVGGGIDCEHAAPLAERLARFASDRFRFGTLMYAGNRHLADAFLARHPATVIVDNPLAGALVSERASVFGALRDAYLDDLVYKEGVSELRAAVHGSIRPTPEVVSSGFHRAISQRSRMPVSGAALLMDVGGATTDLHYTVDLVRDDSESRPAAGASVARYVFTDLGVAASRDSAVLQLRNHPRLYQFLDLLRPGDVREVYGALREGEHPISAELLGYACVFLALDRFARGRGPGLPVADLARVDQLVLTGGAAQGLDVDLVGRLFALFIPETRAAPAVLVDRRYQLWTDGITWSIERFA